MDMQARQNLHDEQTNDCRNFGSNIHQSSQSRKISIGIMADTKPSTRGGAMKGDRAVMPNTERGVSNVGNSTGEKGKVEGRMASFNKNQTGGPETVNCSWISKSFYQRTPTSETILQANQASKILVTPGGQDKPDQTGCTAAKHSAQLFSYQTSTFPSNNYKKFDGDAGSRKGRKDENTERVEEFTFTTAPEVIKTDKTKPEDKTNRSENSTESLRMKLCQILGTTASPKTPHLGSDTHNISEERLPVEQGLKQKENRFVKTRQNSDSIETDSENPDHTPQRPVTRSLSRKRAFSKKEPGEGKNVRSSKYTQMNREKSLFSFEEKWTGKEDAFPNDGSSSKKKSKEKNSRIGRHKICFTENFTGDKLHQDTSKADLPVHDETTFSPGNKMGGLTGCLPDYLRKRPQAQKINREEDSYHPPTVNNTDQHAEPEVSENENQQEYRSTSVLPDAAKSPDNFQSPTFQLETPILSSPSPTPKTDRKANDVSSPASTERRISLGTIRNLRTFQALEPDFNELKEQRQSSDMGELKYSIPGKEKSQKVKKKLDSSSDSSSEERNFEESHEGSLLRHTAERKTFTLHPIKRLRKHEGIKFSYRNPASVLSKGTGENDWIDEPSEQNQDGFVRAVELLASELIKLKSKLKSMTTQKSSEILMSVAEEIHLQLQNVHSQIQTDIGKLTNVSKSKRKQLEKRFEDQQKQLSLIYDRFKEEVNLHLQDCRSTIEDIEADQIEIKGSLEKQRASHKKLLSQVEEAMEIQLNDAQRKITATQEVARGKMLQLKHIIAMCLKDGFLN